MRPSMITPHELSFALAASALIACQHAPTYREDVQPILARQCVTCHRKGGVGPIPELTTFEQVRAQAGKVRLAVQMRDMPPWGAENTGLCGTWHDASWLSDDELRTLVKWTENPVEGDVTRARHVEPPAPPAFQPSGVVLDTGGDYRPGLGPSAYRCFVAGAPAAPERLATAFRVVSTEPRSVQQVTLYALDTDEGANAAQALDATDAELGYTCYGGTRTPGARLLTSWTWDSPVSRIPSGYGVRLPAGRHFVVQVHYNPIATGLGVPTHTRVELELADGVRAAEYFAVTPDAMSLAPRSVHVEARAEVTLPRPMQVLGAAPRMHTLGKTMQLDRLEAGEWRCTGSFDHWDFYRQRLFVLERPLALEVGTHVRVTCGYDTESRGAPTRLGETIDDEECRLELLVAAE